MNSLHTISLKVPISRPNNSIGSIQPLYTLKRYILCCIVRVQFSTSCAPIFPPDLNIHRITSAATLAYKKQLRLKRGKTFNFFQPETKFSTLLSSDIYISKPKSEPLTIAKNARAFAKIAEL